MTTETPEQALRRGRLEANFSQKELADQLGISPQYLSDIESGNREVTNRLIPLLPLEIRHMVIDAVQAALRTKIADLERIRLRS